jgi:hypothetical protein
MRNVLFLVMKDFNGVIPVLLFLKGDDVDAFFISSLGMEPYLSVFDYLEWSLSSILWILPSLISLIV